MLYQIFTWVNRDRLLKHSYTSCAAGSLRSCIRWRSCCASWWTWRCQRSSGTRRASPRTPAPPRRGWRDRRSRNPHHSPRSRTHAYRPSSPYHSSCCSNNTKPRQRSRNWPRAMYSKTSYPVFGEKVVSKVSCSPLVIWETQIHHSWFTFSHFADAFKATYNWGIHKSD